MEAVYRALPVSAEPTPHGPSPINGVAIARKIQKNGSFIFNPFSLENRLNAVYPYFTIRNEGGRMASAETSKEKHKLTEWTTKIPMVDLETAMKAVKDIHDKALENATMPAVAKSLGYASPSSSPFYRRVAAARLFGLLGQGAGLTQAARDYIRPHDEGTKSAVLVGAIRGIPE